MWNPFKKAKSQMSSAALGMMQKIALKKLEKMNPEERQKIMAEAFNPKNREKMISVMEQMKAAGQITEDQYRAAKEKMLR